MRLWVRIGLVLAVAHPGWAGGPARAEGLEIIEPPDALRKDFRLDPFYKKCILTGGFPIVGSAKVSDFALREAAYLIDHVLAGRDDVREALVKGKVRFGILAASEFTTDLPEYRNLKPPLFWNKRARGLGATPRNPLVSCGEENLLTYPGDPYEGENILIHEFAHAIHGVALRALDRTFDERLGAAYAEAMRQGLWKQTYAATNRAEYWAEGVQSYFDCNRRRDPQHNGVVTHEQLAGYDPRLAKLVAEVFKGNDWRYVQPDRRKEAGHLAGFDPALAPRFAWSREVLEWNAANLGNGTIRRKAGPSEIVIATKARFAGAIASLTWNGKEFLDAADHGRLLQSAANFDCGGAFVPETFNPTEAGARADGAGDRSSSNLHRFQASGSELTSISRMAFWLAPGEKTPDGQPARNDKILSDHWLTRRVRLGYKDLPHAIDYEVTFTVPDGEKHRFAQFEALTGYVPAEFEVFHAFDPASEKLSPLDDGPGEQPYPVVFATKSGTHALGVFSPDQPSRGFEKVGYGRFRFPREQVNKWNCVFRLRDAKGIAGDRYTFRVFVAVGSLKDVRETLSKLTKLANGQR
jgi:hypothetical protein